MYFIKQVIYKGIGKLKQFPVSTKEIDCNTIVLQYKKEQSIKKIRKSESPSSRNKKRDKLINQL